MQCDLQHLAAQIIVIQCELQDEAEECLEIC